MYIEHKLEIITFGNQDVFAGLNPGSMDESGGGGSQHSYGGDGPSDI